LTHGFNTVWMGTLIPFLNKVFPSPCFKGFSFGISSSQIELGFPKWRLSKFKLHINMFLSCFLWLCYKLQQLFWIFCTFFARYMLLDDKMLWSSFLLRSVRAKKVQLESRLSKGFSFCLIVIGTTLGNESMCFFWAVTRQI